VLVWSSRPPALARGTDEGQQEAVVALGPDGLHRGGRDPGLARHDLEQAPGASHRRVVAAGVDHRAAPHDVVDHDHTARPGEADGPAEVVGVALLVGVDEREVERTPALLRQDGQGVEGLAHHDLHPVGHTGPLEVGHRHLGVARLGLEGHDPPARGEGPGQPDGAVAPEGPHLEDRPGPDHPGPQVEELPLVRRHVDGRQPGLGAGHQRRLERRVVPDQEVAEVPVDLPPTVGRVGQGPTQNDLLRSASPVAR
jgi:hypothetical protein